jgi:hypothetical protein
MRGPSWPSCYVLGVLSACLTTTTLGTRPLSRPNYHWPSFINDMNFKVKCLNFACFFQIFAFVAIALLFLNGLSSIWT